MNYKQIEQDLIPARRSFTHGHSMRGINTGTEYLIYSYSTLIAKVLLPSQQVAFFNGDKYSSTTTRQQNLVKRALNVQA